MESDEEKIEKDLNEDEKNSENGTITEGDLHEETIEEHDITFTVEIDEEVASVKETEVIAKSDLQSELNKNKEPEIVSKSLVGEKNISKETEVIAKPDLYREIKKVKEPEVLSKSLFGEKNNPKEPEVITKSDLYREMKKFKEPAVVKKTDSYAPKKNSKVFSGSPAEGILQRNDEIKLLDNCNVEHASSKEIQDLIRTSGSQLNFIVARDSNKSTNYDIQIDEKPSIQNTRLKFINNESRPTFGQFGTEFHKKSNTLPTSLTIETNNEFTYKDNIMNRSYEMDEDDTADYNFMTLPVSERKKLFASPDDKVMSKTMPRQRFHSFRPTYKAQTLPKPQTTAYQRKPQDFGWQPSPQKLERARNAAQSQSAVPFKYQTTLAESPRINRSYGDKVSNTYTPRYQQANRLIEPNRRYSSSTTIPTQMRKNLTSSMLNCSNDGYSQHPRDERIKSQTKYVYHCGPNIEHESTQPSIMIIPSNIQPKNLYVNTYGVTNQSLSPAQSPRYFRPAYPAYSTDHGPSDNMSIISVRSEPYSKRMDRSIGYDRTGTYRILRDSTSAQRESHFDGPFDKNRLQIGEPRTRIVANPASPTCHLNWSFWGPDQKPTTNYDRPVHSFNVETSPKIVNSRSFRIRPSVPKSQSTLLMNPASSMNDSVHSESSWLKKHRDSSAGISDF